MKHLATTFRADQFDFKQIHREGMFAIYEKSKPGFSKPGYEVIRIKHQKAGSFKLNDGTILNYKEKEAYPSSGEWGTYGWTCTTKERAFEKLRELVSSCVPQ